jgi:electron transfer flavoprotein beta subunit
MRIYACVKHVPDTAAHIRPLGGIEFDETVKFIMNPHDEYGLEQALLVRDQTGHSEVVAVTVGKESAAATLRFALAMGANRAIHVKTGAYFMDGLQTARLLFMAIQSGGSPDLIFTGKQSIDTEGMQLPYRLGVLFDMPVAVNVTAFSISDGLLTLEREIDGGLRELISMPMPCIIGAARGLNRPRCPTLPDMMKARKKEILTIHDQEPEHAPDRAPVELLDLQAVPDRGRAQMLEGGPGEMTQELLAILRKNKIL